MKTHPSQSLLVIADSFGLAWVPIANKSVLAFFEKGSSYFYTTTGMSDCGTELGRKYCGKANGKTDFSSEIIRFKRKGWSDNKIPNWLAEKQKNRLKNSRVNASIGAGAELKNWHSFIGEILGAKYSRHLNLLIHMYHRGLENERIEIKCLTKIRLYDLSDKVLLNIEKDNLYQFTL
jgi:hypothetical protein